MELTVTLSILSLLSLILRIAAAQQNFMGIKPRFRTVRAGEPVTIHCSVVPRTDIFSVLWSFGCEEENLADHQHYTHRISLFRDGLDMTITNLTEDDSGIYFCQVLNQKGSKGKDPGTILVVTPISHPAAAAQQDPMGRKPPLLTVTAGESVTIHCPIVPDKKFFSVLWSFGCEEGNLFYFQHYTHRMTLPRDGRDMTITNLTEDDSGIYSCQVDGSKTKDPGTILVVTPISHSAGPDYTECPHDPVCPAGVLKMVLDVVRIICLIILIIVMVIAVKQS
ncbi:protein sidekick-like [Dendropsophus ebraccatus]|uniref:protein sidekick-like n=1 Tax=Dendropsophus ebraccatus TaxID=150705 RepID=UPI003831CAAC